MRKTGIQNFGHKISRKGRNMKAFDAASRIILEEV